MPRATDCLVTIARGGTDRNNMQADIQILHNSDLCSIHNFLCNCHERTVSGIEYQEQFAFAYVRRGNFQFKAYRNELDVHHGLFLLCKPGYEYRVGHVHNMPDQCTIFYLPSEKLKLLMPQGGAFSWFFDNPDMHSIAVRATPEMEYLHYCIFQLAQESRSQRLWIEQLMADLFLLILSSGRDSNPEPVLTEKQKRVYLPAIESVKSFIAESFTENVSLSQLADVANISPFHFNRLFRQITSFTPHNYLLRVRLLQADLHLCNTDLSVTAIAFSCGFNSLEHFSAAYKCLFGIAPSMRRL